MNEMSLWLIVFVKIMARGGVKGQVWAWLVSVYSGLWCIPVPLNLNLRNTEENVSHADSSGWPVNILFREWQVTAVLSMAAGQTVYLHVSVDFGDKKALVLQKQRYMHPPTNIQLRTANSCGWPVISQSGKIQRWSPLQCEHKKSYKAWDWCGFLVLWLRLPQLNGDIKRHVSMALSRRSRQNPPVFVRCVWAHRPC